MEKTEIDIEILEDGTVRWKTGKVPSINHDDAQNLQKELEQALGGEVKRESIAAKPRHTHHHDHDHIHTQGGG